MKKIIQRRLAKKKRKITRRFEPFIGGTAPVTPGKPEFSASNIVYEIGDRTEAVSAGGIGAIKKLVDSIGLTAAIGTFMCSKRRARIRIRTGPTGIIESSCSESSSPTRVASSRSDLDSDTFST